MLPSGTVLIAGGGPVGLTLARVLSFYGTRSILFERSKTTTSWPKMDLTNARSMELFRKLGLAEDLRLQGVPPEIDQDVLISSGLSQEKPLTMWKLPGWANFANKSMKPMTAHNLASPGNAFHKPYSKSGCEKFARRTH